MRKTFKAIGTYDPCFGFKIIKRDEVVYCTIRERYFIQHLENEQGQLIATIDNSDLRKLFVEVK